MAISPFKIIIFIIIAIRLLLFGLPSFSVDMGAWQAWAERLVDFGPSNFYSETYFSDYFPGYLYILWTLGEIYKIIFVELPFNTFLFEAIIKSVTTIFDLATAFYIFKIISRYRERLAYLSVLFYLANPALIFNSSIWGQVDGIFTFFLVFGIYNLLEKKSIVKSNLSLAFAILIKPQGIAMLPAFFNKINKILLVPIFLFLFSLPFFPNDILGLLKMSIRLEELYPYNSLFAYNFWSLFDWWQLDSKSFLSLSQQIWGIIIYVLVISLILIPLIFKKIKNHLFYLSSSLLFLSFYLFLTRMHERYLFPFFAFLLIAALLMKSKSLIVIYISVSLVHFLNLWYVYYFYNFVFKGVGETNIIYNLIDSNYKLLSIFLILIFVYLLIIYYRFLFPAFKPKIRFI